ncbi:MAG: hypothetical protein ACAI25_11205 [Planctomycetota bacterium]
MGLFDWAGDAWDGVTGVAADAWDATTGFVQDHWKTIAAVTIGTLVFVGVATFAPALLPGLFALAPTLAPWLVLGGAGAASGAATRAFDDLLEGRTPGWDVLQAALLTGAVTVVSAGTLSWLGPKLGEAIPRLKPLTDRFVIAGGSAGEGASAVEPVIKVPGIAPPPPANVPSIAAAGDGLYPHLSAGQAAWRAPKTRGLIGLLSGDAGQRANDHLDREPLVEAPPRNGDDRR